MDKEKIVSEIINNIYSISNNSLSELLRITHFESIPSEKTFIKISTRNEYEYFALSGICRSYLINPEGEDITISFFLENSVLTPNTARTFNNYSSLNFQALTDMEIGVFNANKLVELMKINPELRSFANSVLQKELILKVKKEINNASLSAKERLIDFRKQLKSLENIIPHPLIASYLGITNISLSRLRSDLARE